MATKRLTRPNEFRGKIFDKLAECFGNSVLGMYEGKLRIEWVEDDGKVVQFSLAPVVHKTTVDEEECDQLVPIAQQMAEYETAAAEKSATKTKTSKKDEPIKIKVPTKNDGIGVPINDVPEITPQQMAAPKQELSDEQKAKLQALSDSLNL